MFDKIYEIYIKHPKKFKSECIKYLKINITKYVVFVTGVSDKK